MSQHEVLAQNGGEAQDQEGGLHKNEFLVMLAHELRNPLASICNILEIWKAGDADKVEEKNAQAIMGRQLQKIAQLVDDLLDVSGVTCGVTILEEEAVDLLQVVNYAVEASRNEFAARHQEISVSLPKEKVFVRGDTVRLKQVLCNLLVNASKYTELRGHIAVTLACEAGDALIRVVDDGLGLSPELLPHVFTFDHFVESRQSPDRQQRGLGLGLTLVRRFVELHGGTVEAKSAGPKKGSEFIVRLPVMMSGVAAGPAPAAPEFAAEKKAEKIAPAAGTRVLVIEDDADSAKTTQMLLVLLGHKVLVAFSGPSGIEAAQVFRPEVILLDIGLPGMNGFDVAKRLRELPETRNTLLVALSGYGQTEDIRKSKEAGFDHHLVKPADTHQLQKLISEAGLRKPSALV